MLLHPYRSQRLKRVKIEVGEDVIKGKLTHRGKEYFVPTLHTQVEDSSFLLQNRFIIY